MEIWRKCFLITWGQPHSPENLPLWWQSCSSPGSSWSSEPSSCSAPPWSHGRLTELRYLQNREHTPHLMFQLSAHPHQKDCFCLPQSPEPWHHLSHDLRQQLSKILIYWMYVTWEVEVNSFKFLLFEFSDYFFQVFEDIFWAGIDTFGVFIKHLFQLFFVIYDPRKISQWTIVFLQKKQDGQILKEKQSQFGLWISSLLWSQNVFLPFHSLRSSFIPKNPQFSTIYFQVMMLWHVIQRYTDLCADPARQQTLDS